MRALVVGVGAMVGPGPAMASASAVSLSLSTASTRALVAGVRKMAGPGPATVTSANSKRGSEEPGGSNRRIMPSKAAGSLRSRAIMKAVSWQVMSSVKNRRPSCANCVGWEGEGGAEFVCVYETLHL